MALDASVGNRAKENYSIKLVDLSEEFNSSEIKEIRKLLALECVMLKRFNALERKTRDKVVKEVEALLDLDDRELVKKKGEEVEISKKYLGDDYSIITYNTANDNTVVACLKNNKTGLTENILVEIPRGIDLSEYIKSLADKLKELKNNKAISVTKKKILVLKHVIQDQR